MKGWSSSVSDDLIYNDEQTQYISYELTGLVNIVKYFIMGLNPKKFHIVTGKTSKTAYKSKVYNFDLSDPLTRAALRYCANESVLSSFVYQYGNNELLIIKCIEETSSSEEDQTLIAKFREDTEKKTGAVNMAICIVKPDGGPMSEPKTMNSDASARTAGGAKKKNTARSTLAGDTGRGEYSFNSIMERIQEKQRVTTRAVPKRAVPKRVGKAVAKPAPREWEPTLDPAAIKALAGLRLNLCAAVEDHKDLGEVKAAAEALGKRHPEVQQYTRRIAELNNDPTVYASEYETAEGADPKFTVGPFSHCFTHENLGDTIHGAQVASKMIDAGEAPGSALADKFHIGAGHVCAIMEGHPSVPDLLAGPHMSETTKRVHEMVKEHL